MRKLVLVLEFVLFLAVVYAGSFGDIVQGDFNNGTYANTSYNGAGVILSGNNLTGTYTSRVFDAGNLARWDNLSAEKVMPSKEYLYAADDNSDVWNSTDYGLTWALVKDDYNGALVNGAKTGAFNLSGSFYIIYNQKVWASSNLGVTWTLMSDDYNGAEGNSADTSVFDKNGVLYIIEGDQDVWKSNNSGVTWTKQSSNFNGGNGIVAGVVVNSSNVLFAVDVQADVWKSNDGVIWTLVKDDYNSGDGNNADAMTIDRNNVLYVLDSVAVWKSGDSGVTWTKQTSDFDSSDAHPGISITVDSNNTLYIIDGGEDVYKSGDSGVTWTKQSSNFNGGNGNARVFTSLLRVTNITLGVRNCSSSNCADGIWQSANLDNMNLTGRYFQYRADFSTQEAGLTPKLYNASLNYGLVDTVPPSITIWMPQNATYAGTNVFLNYTVSDAGGIGSCWYSRDTSGNISLPGCTTASIVGLTDGGHVIRVYANDTLGNLNMSSVWFSMDSTSPSWSNMANYTPVTYSASARSQFNVTWGDTTGMGSVWLESNFSGTAMNYSMYSLGGGVYGFNASLPAGGFYWRSWANDSFGNLNASDVQTVSVAKAVNNLVLFLNGSAGDLNVNYGASVNVSAIASSSGDGDVAYNLYRNGNVVGTGKSVSEAGVFGAGNYIYSYNSSEGQNYSANGISYALSVNKTAPTLRLFINGTEANATQDYGTMSNVTANISNNLEISLLRDGSVVASGSGSISENIILGAGVYNYTAVYAGNENYSSVTKSYFLDIEKVQPSLSLLFNGQSAPASILLGTGEVDASLANPVGESVSLYEEENLVDSGVLVSYDKNYTTVGERIWKVVYAGNENYSSYNLSGSVTVLDQGVPQYSNLRVSVSSPATYLSGREYEFNATWVDNVAVSDVIFSFNGTNYSYGNGEINKSGDEYSVSLGDFAVGNYSYRWYGFDGSGNVVATPVQQYIIGRASAALFLTMTPEFSIGYGSESYVRCDANNPESVISLSRNSVIAENPDNVTLLVPSVYNYVCSSALTQNYSSTSTFGTLIVNKGSPVIELLLNGQNSDINLPYGGGNVIINATLTRPSEGYINVTVDGIFFSYALNRTDGITSITSTGSHIISAYYYGNANYSSESISRSVNVASSSGGGSSGGGSSGGGGGGSSISGGIVNISFKGEFLGLDDIYVRSGDSKNIDFEVRNSGRYFGNKCKASISGVMARFISAGGEEKGIAPGERQGYVLGINIPSGTETGEYTGDIKITCDEGSISKTMGIFVYLNPFSAEIKDYERKGNELEISYVLREYSGEDRELRLNYVLIGIDGVIRAEGSEDIVLEGGKTEERKLVIKLPKDSFGEFELRFSLFQGDLKSESTRKVFLPSESGVTGLAIFGENGRILSVIGILIVMIAVLIFVIRGIRNYRRRTFNYNQVGRRLIDLHKC